MASTSSSSRSDETTHTSTELEAQEGSIGPAAAPSRVRVITSDRSCVGSSGGSCAADVDESDDPIPQRATSGAHKKQMKRVICASRRTDLPADRAKLDNFLQCLRTGSITYDHPRFARNPVCHKQCTVDLRPESVLAISFWSKDYSHLLAAWTANPILSSYHHHFSFTINGPDHSILEPGVGPSFEARLEQLSALVALCRSLGQDPNASIKVHIDPIVRYSVDGGKTWQYNLGHVGRLFDHMRSLGLARLHMSFMQFTWQSVRSRIARFGPKLQVRTRSHALLLLRT
jgi:hypothetical protein